MESGQIVKIVHRPMQTEEIRPPDVVEEAAKQVVALLTEYANGRPLDNYLVLRDVAQDCLACKVVHDLGGGSSYCPVEAGKWRGVIRLDVQQEPEQVVRDLAHELTHHILYIYEFAGIAGVAIDTDLLEEMICHTVAGIVKALPAGLLWNGKLALPIGDGTIRVFSRLDVYVRSQSIPPEEWDD